MNSPWPQPGWLQFGQLPEHAYGQQKIRLFCVRDFIME